MGQKTNPISLRININRNFESSWFQDDSMKYSQLLHQDLKIREYLKSLFTFIGIHTGRINLQVFPKKLIIHYFLHDSKKKKVQRQLTFSSEKFQQLLFIQNLSFSQKKNFEEYLQFVTKNHMNYSDFRKHFFLRFFLIRFFFSENQNILSTKTALNYSYEFLKLVNPRIHEVDLSILKRVDSTSCNSGVKDVSLMNEFKTQRTQLTIDKNLKHIESILTKNLQCHSSILPMKIDSRYKSAQFICDYVCQRLQENLSFRQIFKQLLQEIKNHNEIQGMRIVCSGRLGGVEMARVESKKYGQTSLHVFSSKIDYASEQAYTLFGLLGVKVWLSFRN